MPTRKAKSTLLIVALLLLVASWIVVREGATWVGAVMSTEYPQRAVYADGLAKGKLPLWNPYVLGGYPQLAAGEPGPLYPPNLILHLLTSIPIALTLFLVVHVFWVALGTFALARRWSLSKLAACGASLLLLLSGFLSTKMGQPGVVASVSWLPWQFLFADRILQPELSPGRSKNAALFALTSGMTFLTGQISGAMMAIVATMIYALCLLVARRTVIRALLWQLLGAAVGILLASAQLLPGLELARVAAPTPLVQSGGFLAGLSTAVTYLLPGHWSGLIALSIALLAGFLADRVRAQTAGRGRRLALVLATLGLVALDVTAYSTPRGTGPSWFEAMARLQLIPDSAAFLRANAGLYRVLPEHAASTVGATTAESLPLNLPMTYRLFGATGSADLIPGHYARFQTGPTHQMLNLLGVKYLLVPLDPSADAVSDSGYRDAFMYNPLDDVMPTSLVMASAVELEWYLSDSADWENQTPVALLTFMTEETVDIMEYILSAGSHTADWALERSDLRGRVKHDRAIVARTFPARSSPSTQWFSGQVYRTTIRLPYAVLIHGIKIESMASPERVHIERFTLIDQGGARYLFSHMAGFSDHTLAFRSDEVAIFENHDVFPRAFLTYDAIQAADDSEASALLHSSSFEARRQVVITGQVTAIVAEPTVGTEKVEIESYASDRVVVHVQAPADGYLVLTDTWYPGWRAFVDGTEVTVPRADLAFRAVFVPEGEHRVSFMYDPVSFRVGLAVSSLALALWLAWWLLSTRRAARQAS